MSHTPGPWYAGKTAGDHQGTVISEPTGKTVAVAYDKNDAPLLAAAPNLLVACKAALNDRMYKDWPEIATLLKDAIANAEGTA